MKHSIGIIVTLILALQLSAAPPPLPKTGVIYGNDFYTSVVGDVLTATVSGSGLSGATQFATLNLAGFGDDFFNTGWSIYVVTATNISAGTLVDVSDYASSTGTFTTATAGANWASGDKILLIRVGPTSIDELNAVGSVCYPGKVTSTSLSGTDTLYCEQWIGLGNDRFNDGFYVEVTYHPTTAPRREIRKVSDFFSSTGSVLVSPVFSDTVDVGDILTIWHHSAIVSRLPGRLNYEGSASVTGIATPADSFYVADLIGFGDSYFNRGRYWAHVIYTTDGAAPLGEYLPITGYTSNNGLFQVSSVTGSTQAGFSAVITALDRIAILHESQVMAARGNPMTGMKARVDNVSTNGVANFYVSELKSYPDSALVGSWVKVVQDAGGAGAAPQGERSKISKFNSATGLITLVTAFTVAPAGGDIIRIYNGDVEDVLWGDGGIPTWPAAAKAANGVSVAENARYVQQNVDSVMYWLGNAAGLGTFPAAEDPANGANLAGVIRQIHVVAARDTVVLTGVIKDTLNHVSVAADSIWAAVNSVRSWTDTEITAVAVVVDSVRNWSERPVTKATAALPQTTTDTLFIGTGSWLLNEITGVVTVDIGAIANNTKLKVLSGATTTDICSVLDITGDLAASTYTVTGTFANALVNNAVNTPLSGGQAAPIRVVSNGTWYLILDCAGSDGGTGRVRWSVQGEPISAGGTITAD